MLGLLREHGVGYQGRTAQALLRSPAGHCGTRTPPRLTANWLTGHGYRGGIHQMTISDQGRAKEVTPLNVVPMWPHQRDAVSAVLSELADSARTTVVMACGTGKTRVGSETADAIAPDGPVLIVLPTLDLTAQTLSSWLRTSGRDALGTVIAVCSDDEIMDRDSAKELGSLRAQVTTDPGRLARLLEGRGDSRCTVAVTYQSLPLLVAAHRDHAVAPWTLLIFDEAHRSAGVRSRTWSIVHDDALIPAARRFYMTATPRLVVTRRGGHGSDEVFSMDDEKTYGRAVYRLPFARARELGLLADYRVVVAIITDEEIQQLAAAGDQAPFLGVGPAAVSAPMLARQIAVLRAAREFGIDRILTYHRLVRDAQWFSRTLPAADALLQGTDGAATDLVTGCVHGGQTRAERWEVLDRLRDTAAGRVVISNSRVLSEGVDIPAVNGVAFIDVRDSPIDTVQALGRAMRLGGQPDKTAYIIVPVLLKPGQDAVSALEGSAYAPVWRVAQALRAQDETFAAALDAARAAIGQAGTPRARLGNVPDWLHVSGISVPAAFVSAITVHAVTATTETWEEYYGAACAYQQREGNLLIPSAHVTASGLRLGSWLAEQGKMHGKGRLRPDRLRRLEAIGAVFGRREIRLQRHLSATRDYHRQYGHLRVPFDYVTTGEDPVDLGAFLIRVRRARQKLTPEQKAELEQLGLVLDTVGDDHWNRMFAAATAYRREHGDLLAPATHITDDDPPLRLGEWLVRCRYWKKRGQSPLTPQRIRDLDALGMTWDAHAYKWRRGFQFAQAYFQKHGDLRVVTTFETEGPEAFKLGAWIRKQRRNLQAGSLTKSQVEDLTRIGMIWSLPPGPKAVDCGCDHVPPSRP
ncbi:Helicase associated domain protein [Streptomyces sp. NPDC056244]|uniref:DEAD/DEAH box helicase n=1 Tax=Streptomyces sp. NPDC056244 TaxID=3345762 RepID=UPI0035E0DD5C